MKSVIIVGGGAIGLFCALRLAKAGARVTLLEEQIENTAVSSPTTSASAAGMLAPVGEELSPHDAVAFESYSLWRSWSKGALWQDAVHFDGGVVASRTAEEARAFLGQAKALGAEAVALSAKEFFKRTGLSTPVEHSVLVVEEGIADPIRMLTGLVMDARAHGVLVIYNEDVLTVAPNQVTTFAKNTYEADIVLLAPGAWSTEALMEAAPALRRIRPARGHLVQVRLNRALAPNLRAPGFYLAERREDVVLGSDMEFDVNSRRANPERVQELLAAAEAFLPGEVRTTGRAWAGIRPMSSDGWPMIGKSGDVLVAAGHSRNGWLLAPITAEIITAYVMGAAVPPEWAALSPDRFGSP